MQETLKRKPQVIAKIDQILPERIVELLTETNENGDVRISNSGIDQAMDNGYKADYKIYTLRWISGRLKEDFGFMVTGGLSLWRIS